MRAYAGGPFNLFREEELPMIQFWIDWVQFHESGRRAMSQILSSQWVITLLKALSAWPC